MLSFCSGDRKQTKAYLKQRQENPVPSVVLTNLIDLSAGFEVVALITAAEQLKRLVHMVPRILDLGVNMR